MIHEVSCFIIEHEFVTSHEYQKLWGKIRKDSVLINSRSCTEIDFQSRFLLTERICNTNEDFEAFRRASKSAKQSIFKTKTCSRNVWKYNVMYQYKEDKINGTMITILMPSDEMEIIQQVRLYSLTNFIADFGGYLGLLLGASVLSMFDVILNFCQSLRLIN